MRSRQNTEHIRHVTQHVPNKHTVLLCLPAKPRPAVDDTCRPAATLCIVVWEKACLVDSYGARIP